MPYASKFRAAEFKDPVEVDLLSRMLKSVEDEFSDISKVLPATYYSQTQLKTDGKAEVHWNNITNKPSAYPPSAHATTHEKGGSDLIDTLGDLTVDTLTLTSTPIAFPDADFQIKKGTESIFYAGSHTYVRTPSGEIRLRIGSSDKLVVDSSLIHLNLDLLLGTSPFIKWQDGNLVLQTNKGTNEDTIVVIQGKGTGYGSQYIFDEDNAEALFLYSIAGYGAIQAVGTSPQGLLIQYSQPQNVTFWQGISSGNPILAIFGVQSGAGPKFGSQWVDTSGIYNLQGEIGLRLNFASYYLNALADNNKALDSALLEGQNGAYYLAWANITGKPSTYPPSNHDIITSHTDSGLTVGYVIRATGTTTFAWAQLQHSDLGGVSANQHHAQLHASSHNLGEGDELNHDNLAGFVVAEHLSLPNTITNVLTNHTKAIHDALGLDHGALSGRGDDDHNIYILVSGLRAFTGVVSGITPTAAAHLATKGYVDTEIAGVGGNVFYSRTPQALSLTIDNTWRDLDVTSYTSANAKWAILKMKGATSSTYGGDLLLREKGETNHCAEVTMNGDPDHETDKCNQVIVPLDSSQVFQYKAYRQNATVAFSLYIVGWIE